MKNSIYDATCINGAIGPARAYWLKKIIDSKKHSFIITHDSKSAAELIEDLNFFGVSTQLFPILDTLPFELVAPNVDLAAARIRAIFSLHSDRPVTFVTPVTALFQKVPNYNYLRKIALKISKDQELPRQDFLERLDLCGYRRVSLVQELGDIAVRGRVVDIFPPAKGVPIRIEFDGDVVNRLRSFDATSQRSDLDIEEVDILPVSELIRDSHELSDFAVKVRKQGEKTETPLQEIESVIQSIQSGMQIGGIEVLQAIYTSHLVPVTDYIRDNKCQVILDNKTAIELAAETFEEVIISRQERYLKDHILIPDKKQIFIDAKELLSFINSTGSVTFDSLPVFENQASSKEIKVRSRYLSDINIQIRSKANHGEGIELLAKYIRKILGEGFRVAFIVGTDARKDRLFEYLNGYKLPLYPYTGSCADWLDSINPNPCVCILGQISKSIEITDDRIVFIAEQEIFHERSAKKSKKKISSLRKLMNMLSNLHENDFVVHIDYGVGIYKGLIHKEIEGKITDFLLIEYADSRLFLPVQLISKIHKFSASEGQKPIVDKLSSTRWSKTKSQVRKSVENLAGELIKLYATRKEVKGWRFDQWGAEDERFAESFIYSETEDQGESIIQTISDMASDRPMDRLICGDVGFGKTEVAIRAVFKCLQHARQVAVLVPTTLLAEQHTENFKRRFSDYSYKIEGVSRFHTAKKNSETLRLLSNGQLDVIVGTHRLLSQDVHFNDLGLVIIDEEHRFGVKQKEKLKKFKQNVDVLTLTATPIPRTLHMSLLGIRDVSIIASPPADRKVIRTYTAREEEGLIRDVVMRELERGGQCFYVRPRIEGIVTTKKMLEELIPEARIEYAHGQMREHQLEKIMEKFLKHEIDVLISTTIVESGLDIANANTILIERADMFGLAQLYQLRGRVGRSAKQAFCYFLVPKKQKLGVVAENRLKALQGLDDLGVGFQLALRDMEIRGVGNLLGGEQSGNIISVGYELYMKILNEAVQYLKGEEIEAEVADPEVNFAIDTYIPEFYIPDVAERLILYQRLAQISDNAEAESLLMEVEDRFGPLPIEGYHLLEMMKYRALLKKLNIVKAEYSKDKLQLSLSSKGNFSLEKINKLVKSNPQKYRFTKGLQVTVFFDNEESPDIAELAEYTADFTRNFLI